MLSLKPSHLARYRDVAWLLIKYGFSDLVHTSSLGTCLPDEPCHDDDEKANRDSSPREFAADLEQLGPTFVKLGQVLSSRGDLLPKPYLDALSRLHDDVQRVPFEHIERIIFEELGKRVDVLYKQFEREPMAAASLAQVHRARLHDGTLVAVKIQRPGIRRQIAEDLESLMEIATELEAHSSTARRYEICRIVDTLAARLSEELNYRNELQNAKRLRENLSSYENIQIPRMFDELCTDRVLTMEFIEGRKITKLSEEERQQLNGKALADELFECYLHQLLVDGCFHADPHPGNLVLTNDGRICLLDFGLMTKLNPSMRSHLLKVLVHLSEGRGEQVAHELLNTSRETSSADAAEFRELIERLVASHASSEIMDIPAGRVVLEIQKAAADTGLCIREELKMLGKTLLQLDEIVRQLDPDFNPNATLKKHVTQMMTRRADPQTVVGEFWQMATESTELLRAIPQRLNRFTRMLAQNEVRVKVDAVDEAALLKGIHKIANRITAGLVLASLIIGASLMMRLETEWEVFGYPAIAMIFFLTAAFAGLHLVYKATFSDDRELK
jgi:predicted unusual protein kinase regulating ubiquinone biosynthesis (AarF/ABC1/UbiB family)